MLEAHDMTPANVVKVTTFLTDRDWLPPYRAIRNDFFGPSAASTLLFVAGLADPAFHFEIEAEAIA